jgi:hypothetical protein
MTETIQGDALTLAVDTGPCESDRLFFRQHPQRTFRLRPAWTIEIEDFARRGGISSRELPDGLCWWMLVHQLAARAVRLRMPLAAPHYWPPDPPENVARDVWRARAPREWKKHARTLRRELARLGEAA